MERHKYDYQWVSSLLGEGETSRVECKLAVKAIPDSFWESYSAFANTDGGIVLLGIREENRGKYTEKSTERNVALTETEEKIVAILVSNGYATQKSISIKLGITRTYVTKIMGELQSKGVICRVGPDKGGHWEVVKKGRMP